MKEDSNNINTYLSISTICLFTSSITNTHRGSVREREGGRKGGGKEGEGGGKEGEGGRRKEGGRERGRREGEREGGGKEWEGGMEEGGREGGGKEGEGGGEEGGKEGEGGRGRERGGVKEDSNNINTHLSISTLCLFTSSITNTHTEGV